MSTKRKKKNIKITKNRIILYVAIVIILAVSLFFSSKIENALGINKPFYSDISETDYIVHFVDIGQGDCTIFEFPNGDIAIVDSGPQKNESDLKEYLEKVIFKDREDKTIKYLIATHSDEDHIGNFDYILENYDVKTVYRPNIASKTEGIAFAPVVKDTKVYDNFILLSKQENGCTVKTIIDQEDEIISNDSGEVIYSFIFYGPMQDDYSDVNDFSPFILFECNGSKILITGDASIEVENEILSYYGNGGSVGDMFTNRVDVYQVGHHGSRTSTSQELLLEFSPRYAVLSYAKDNDYKHPHAETITRLKEANIEMLNTVDNGNIVFAFNAEGAINIMGGDFKAQDNIHWWMIVLSLDIVFAIIIFGIKIKTSKKI